TCYYFVFFFVYSVVCLVLLSFPTRRSSDLGVVFKDLRRGGVCASESGCSSRHQAEQHSSERRRGTEAARFRYRQAPGERERRGAIDYRGTATSDTDLRFARTGKGRSDNSGD